MGRHSTPRRAWWEPRLALGPLRTALGESLSDPHSITELWLPCTDDRRGPGVNGHPEPLAHSWPPIALTGWTFKASWEILFLVTVRLSCLAVGVLA